MSERARRRRWPAILAAAPLLGFATGADENPRQDFELRCAALCTGDGLTRQQCALLCDCLSADLSRYRPASDWRALVAALEGADTASEQERARLATSRKRCEASLSSGY